jgi:cobyrinic acid a,c-diamide synthase
MLACPALLISGPASGQGKTTITAALARLHRQRGRTVRVFKTGPDYLDPMILERGSGLPVQTLDLWMVGGERCRQLLAEAAEHADLILIEGVMGLFDGAPSSADLAMAFGVPVALVVDAQAMAQTFGAVAFGLAGYRPELSIHGVLANRVGSAYHAQMLQESLPAHVRWLGHVAGSERIALPERHLGLHQASEIDSLDERIACAADALADTALAELPAPVPFEAPPPATVPRLLEGRHIAIARDAAFSFIYPANLDLLQALGARLSFFAPVADEPVPTGADSLYLPGGYPELHSSALAGNATSAGAIRAHAASGKPIVAECGGMLYLLESLTDAAGVRTPMLGVLAGHGAMSKRLSALGPQELRTDQGAMRGHTFHYSSITTALQPVLHAARPPSDAQGEAVFRCGAITATYMHGYWPSNPALTAALFEGRPF